MTTSRNDTSFMLGTSFLIEPVAQTSAQEVLLTEEAIALEDSLRALMRSAKGGTARGECSAVLSDPTMADCSETQLLGRTIGGLRGLGKGADPIDLERVTASLAQSHEKLERVDQGVTLMLKQQSAELLHLQKEHAAGLVSDQEYNTRVTAMQQTRAAVAEALTLSAAQAAKARKMFEQAQDNGQTGLSWYLASMTRIQSVAESAKARLNVTAG
ncbi:hypothetical protein [Tropicibacter oceani]|uniref:Uncharacterized protein n=1 Tax=Tropicibacter oceani TaxID=3058420 RepID=A0ABY8QIT7_9RHOB|nr:hypothetical protein [Tropicibacter oceani]WGW04552.1 hypothetical protein QF118_03090 [Tropicibacter oceani]